MSVRVLQLTGKVTLETVRLDPPSNGNSNRARSYGWISLLAIGPFGKSFGLTFDLQCIQGDTPYGYQAHPNPVLGISLSDPFGGSSNGGGLVTGTTILEWSFSVDLDVTCSIERRSQVFAGHEGIPGMGARITDSLRVGGSYSFTVSWNGGIGTYGGSLGISGVIPSGGYTNISRYAADQLLGSWSIGGYYDVRPSVFSGIYMGGKPISAPVTTSGTGTTVDLTAGLAINNGASVVQWNADLPSRYHLAGQVRSANGLLKGPLVATLSSTSGQSVSQQFVDGQDLNIDLRLEEGYSNAYYLYDPGDPLFYRTAAGSVYAHLEDTTGFESVERRLLLRLPPFIAGTLAQTLPRNVMTGPLQIVDLQTITLPQAISAEDARYLEFDIESLPNGGSLVVGPGAAGSGYASKTFRIPTSVGRSKVRIDLCEPLSAPQSVDMQTSRFPLEDATTDVPFYEGAAWGMNRLQSFQFVVGAQAPRLYSMELVSTSDPVLSLADEGLPRSLSQNPTQAQLVYPFVVANVDHRRALEVPSMKGSVPTRLADLPSLMRSFPSWTFVPAQLTEWYEQPWTAWLGGAGRLYGYGRDSSSIRMTMKSGSMDVTAQGMVDVLSVPPGIGDLSNPVQTFAELQLYALQLCRGDFTGLVQLQLSAGLPRVVDAIDVMQGTNAGESTIDDDDGFWTASPDSRDEAQCDFLVGGLPVVVKGASIQAPTFHRMSRRISFRIAGGRCVDLVQGFRVYAAVYCDDNALWALVSSRETGRPIGRFQVDPNGADASHICASFDSQDGLIVIYVKEGRMIAWRSQSEGRDFAKRGVATVERSDVMRVRSLYNDRTKEIFMLVQSEDRKIQSFALTRSGKLLGPFSIVGATAADDSDFGLTMSATGEGIDVALFIGGVLQIWRSQDEGRTFKRYFTAA